MQQLSNFATNVRKELKNKKKSISWLARESGVSQCMISYYLTGKTEPSLSKATQIAETLEVPLSQLIGEDVFQSKILLSMAKQDDSVKEGVLKCCSNASLLSEIKSRLSQPQAQLK